MGSIIGLATIGALHMLVFKPRADALATERTNYQTLESQIEQLGKTKSMDVINRFDLQNADYMLQFYHMIQNLNLPIPTYFTTESNDSKQRQDLTDWLQKLLALRQPGAKPKLTFLDSDHWSLPEKLPEDVTATGVDLGDRVRQVIDADEVIKVLPEGHPLRLQQEAKYKQLLQNIGVNLDKANGTLPKYGSAVSTFYLLVRAQLIHNALPKDFNLKTPLIDLFRLKWPDQMLVTVKQMEALVDLLGMARDTGVEEVVSVTLQEPMKIYPPPSKEEQKAQATAAAGGVPGMAPGAAPGMYPGAAPGMYPGAEPGMYPGVGPAAEPGMYPGVGPAAEPGMYPGLAGMPGGMPGMMAGPKAATIEAIGSAAPIKMEIVGPNLNVMKFLYTVTHSPRSYGITYLAIKSMDEPSGWIRVITTVNVVVTAGGAKTLMSPKQVKDKIADWDKVKQAMEKKLGIQGQAGAAPVSSTSGAPASNAGTAPAEKPI